MFRVDGIPTSVTLGVKVGEPVDAFWRRALMEASRIAGLPLLEQGWFADAFIAQFPNYMNLTWKDGQDPTPPRAPRWDDNKIKTTDFNHLLLNSYLNANRGAGRNRILPEQLRPYEGRPALIRPARIEDTPNNFGPPLLNVIKMDWVLEFGRSRTVYNEMINRKIWTNVKAKSEIGRMLGRIGVIASANVNPNTRIPFGDLNSANVIEIEKNYVQRGEVFSSEIDGLTASLANFSFRLTIKGFAVGKPNGIEVTIEEIGIYVKDQYDFINDRFYWECLCYDQPLGNKDMWGEDVGKVTNNSFNSWRDKTGKGGDFLIYSDIKSTKLNPPDVFVI